MALAQTVLYRHFFILWVTAHRAELVDVKCVHNVQAKTAVNYCCKLLLYTDWKTKHVLSLTRTRFQFVCRVCGYEAVLCQKSCVI